MALDRSPAIAASIECLVPNRIVKRCASMPADYERPPFRRYSPEKGFCFCKRKIIDSTSLSGYPIMPSLVATIRGVRKLPGAKDGDVLIYLQHDQVFTVDFSTLTSTSSRMYDWLINPEIDHGRVSVEFPDIKGLVPIRACFVLKNENKELRRISREEISPLLKASERITIKTEGVATKTKNVVIKTEDGEMVEAGISIDPSPRLTATPGPSEHVGLPSPNIQAYILLLRLMHKQALELPPTEKRRRQPFQVALTAIRKMILLCKIYDCNHLLHFGAVSNFLFQYRTELLYAIKEDPPKFAILATNIRDNFIMTEVYIHLVGAYHDHDWPWEMLKQKLNKGKGAIILEHARRLAEKIVIDCKLVSLRLMVNSIHVQTEEGSEVRVSILTNKDSWSVVSMFRDWLARALDEADDDPIQLGTIFRILLRGGDAYLPVHDVYEQIKELGVGFDYGELAGDIKIVKDFAKEAVAGLCKNNLMLDAEGNGIQYLTCAEITEDMMPWYGLTGR